MIAIFHPYLIWQLSLAPSDAGEMDMNKGQSLHDGISGISGLGSREIMIHAHRTMLPRLYTCTIYGSMLLTPYP